MVFSAAMALSMQEHPAMSRVSAGPKVQHPPTEDADNPQYRTDSFRMWCLKVLPCSRRYCHDWTTCPFAHNGEKAKRRDPRLFNYTGVACPDMKKNMQCPRGDQCPYAHTVFEYWLHHSRYRTQLCNDGMSCSRKICFFAHTLDELRVSSVKAPELRPESINPFASGPSGGRTPSCSGGSFKTGTTASGGPKPADGARDLHAALASLYGTGAGAGRGAEQQGGDPMSQLAAFVAASQAGQQPDALQMQVLAQQQLMAQMAAGHLPQHPHQQQPIISQQDMHIVQMAAAAQQQSALTAVLHAQQQMAALQILSGGLPTGNGLGFLHDQYAAVMAAATAPGMGHIGYPGAHGMVPTQPRQPQSLMHQYGQSARSDADQLAYQLQNMNTGQAPFSGWGQAGSARQPSSSRNVASSTPRNLSAVGPFSMPTLASNPMNMGPSFSGAGSLVPQHLHSAHTSPLTTPVSLVSALADDYRASATGSLVSSDGLDQEDGLDGLEHHLSREEAAIAFMLK